MQSSARRAAASPDSDRASGQIAVFLTFARCIRSHGFPSFPDRTSGGDLTHQMVAKAGKACVSRAGDA